MNEDKRRYNRYPNAALTVDVARPGIRGIIRTNPSAECLNFSRTGMRFECPQELREGEQLLIDIRSEAIELHELRAEVVSKQQLQDGNWCYGTRFCFEKTRMKKDEVFHQLLMLEDVLRSRSEHPD